MLASLSARSRVVLLFAVSCVCMLTCGTSYAVSAWSPQLKAQLNVTQGEIEMVGVIGGMSSYLSPLSGVLVHALPEWLLSIIVMVCSVFGYIFMALAARSGPGDALHPLRNTTALGTLFCVQNFGAFLLYQMLLVVNVHNMPPARRGTAVAVLAAVVGISASVFTLIYNSPALDSSVSGILLVMGVSLICVSALCAIIVRHIDPVTTWGVEAAGSSPPAPSAVLSAKPALSISGSFVIPPKGSDRDEESMNYLRMGDMHMGHLDDELSHGGSHGPHNRSSSLNGAALALVSEPYFESEEERMAYEQGRQERAQLEVQARVCGGGLMGQVFGAIWFLVHRPTYWLMLIVFILVAGSGLMQINNTGHIVQSLNGGVQDRDLTAMLILLLSLSNGSGRLLMGLSDVVPIRKGWWLVCVCAAMSLMHFANAFIFVRKELVICSVIGVGLAYGGLWSILPIIISEHFGQTNFSMNLGWISFASGLGGLFCNNLTGQFYDNATPAGSNECAGTECYRYGFILCGCASAVAMIVALPLVRHTQKGKRNKNNAKTTPH